MTSQGSAYARFRRALATGNVSLVLAAAAELEHVGLEDALRICVLLRDQPGRYERAAVRWIGRLCLDVRGITLDDVQVAAASFDDLHLFPHQAQERLSALCQRTRYRVVSAAQATKLTPAVREHPGAWPTEVRLHEHPAR